MRISQVIVWFLFIISIQSSKLANRMEMYFRTYKFNVACEVRLCTNCVFILMGDYVCRDMTCEKISVKTFNSLYVVSSLADAETYCRMREDSRHVASCRGIINFIDDDSGR